MMKCINKKATCLALCFVSLYTPVSQAKDGWRTSIGAGYFSGDYSSTEKTDISMVNLAARYKSGYWTLKASVPYLQITGPKSVVGIDGLTVAGGAATTRATNSGMGDLILNASYLFHYDVKQGWGVSAGSKIKLPTANQTKGLGTGKKDFSFYLSPFLQKDNMTYFGTLGYKFYGNTDTSHYNDVWYGSFGVMHAINDAFKYGISASLREKVSNSGEAKRQLTPFISYQIDKDNKLQFYTLKGFSKSSPDWGAGFTFSHQY